MRWTERERKEENRDKRAKRSAADGWGEEERNGEASEWEWVRKKYDGKVDWRREVENRESDVRERRPRFRLRAIRVPLYCNISVHYTRDLGSADQHRLVFE